MTIGPSVERSTLNRNLRDHLARIEALERSLGGGIEWADTGSGAGGGTLPSFVNTSSSIFVDPNDTPLVLDSATGTMHYYSTDAGVFATSAAGRAQILVPGMYVIGCQLSCRFTGTLASDRWIKLLVSYFSATSSEKGYSIEIPYFVGGDEQVLGSANIVQAGILSSHDVALQRLHPISLTAATDYPLEIRPQYYTSATESFMGQVFWLGLWGWRLSDPLDAYHSD
jgi:hypothetical protein